MQTAGDPWRDEEPPHVPWRREHGPLPTTCLLPGDPDRVELFAQVLDDFEILGRRREFVLATGTADGERVAVCSTGIGGPSTEIVLVELARLGVTTVIRTGGMGSVSSDVASGQIVVVDSALTFASGTAAAYEAEPEVWATPEVSKALRAALPGHEPATPQPLSVVSADSYYVGEGRVVPGLEAAAERRYREIIESGAAGIDMEAATVLALGRALRLRCGAILVAHGNRLDDSWVHDFVPRQLVMMRAASRAAAALSRKSE